MNKLKFITYSILALISLGAIFMSGYLYGQSTSQVASDCVSDALIQEGLDIIERGRSSHQYLIDNPDEITPDTGDLRHHKEWVNNYNYLELLIIALRD